MAPKLIGKRVIDFLLVLIELFSLGVTAEAIRANIGTKSAISLKRGPVDPKFHVEGIAPPTIFFSEIQAKWSFMWYKNAGTSFCRFITIHAFDRQTDGQTEFASLDRVRIRFSAVKTTVDFTHL